MDSVAIHAMKCDPRPSAFIPPVSSSQQQWKQRVFFPSVLLQCECDDESNYYYYYYYFHFMHPVVLQYIIIIVALSGCWKFRLMQFFSGPDALAS
jgi:hypothetical protein